MVLTDDQEIRLRAIQLKLEYNGKFALGALIGKQDIEVELWDKDLDNLVEYIKTGKKPK